MHFYVIVVALFVISIIRKSEMQGSTVVLGSWLPSGCCGCGCLVVVVDIDTLISSRWRSGQQCGRGDVICDVLGVVSYAMYASDDGLPSTRCIHP